MMTTLAHIDSLQTVSGIRIAGGAAIPAVSFTGKANSMTVLGKTHCKRGHPLSGDNLYVAPKSGSRGCRACRTLTNKRLREDRMKPEQKRLILQRLREGFSLRALKKGTIGRRFFPGLTIATSQQMRAERLRDPKWSDKVDALSKPLAHAKLVAIGRARRIRAAPALMRNSGLDAYDVIVSATQNINDEVRDEVRGDLFIAVGENRITLAEIPARVREFVAAYNRSNKHSVMSLWGNKSLDAQIFHDGPTRLGDTVTHGLWD